MQFDTDVVVEGEVSVELYLEYDSTRWDEVTRQARYLHGTDTLLFGYTVRPGDSSPEGVGLFLGTERTGFGGEGTIKARGTDVERSPYYLGTGPQADHRVDTTPPFVSSVRIVSRPSNHGTYAAEETISVETIFSESVTLSGLPTLDLEVGGATRRATLSSPTGSDYTDSLVFHYEVQPGDADSDGIGIGTNRLRLNDGGIHDSAGNAANLSHAAISADPTQKVAT